MKYRKQERQWNQFGRLLSMRDGYHSMSIDQNVRIPVKEATFFIRDNEATDKFALKQVKLSEALAKHVRENEDF